MEKVELAK